MNKRIALAVATLAGAAFISVAAMSSCRSTNSGNTGDGSAHAANVPDPPSERAPPPDRAVAAERPEPPAPRAEPVERGGGGRGW
jgi:hypothetical protein